MREGEVLKHLKRGTNVEDFEEDVETILESKKKMWTSGEPNKGRRR